MVWALISVGGQYARPYRATTGLCAMSMDNIARVRRDRFVKQYVKCETFFEWNGHHVPFDLFLFGIWIPFRSL
ncbi:hypothetical protein TNCT_179241 [Trichonephila clavata]|uniref:Uncharacterized protein n=1 Tax=Trichonephila clavata TaxID=2740835 RepID=A0A8X6HHC0_TRICU|nr:hypothetical protein TNCT_179241 [Trichonephila clavata]